VKALLITDIHGATIAAPSLPPADLLFIGGDITNFGRPADVCAVIDGFRERYPVVLAVLGNCDPPQAAYDLDDMGAWVDREPQHVAGLCVYGCGGVDTTQFSGAEERERTDDSDSGNMNSSGELRVLLAHVPPLRSGADVVGSGRNVGSRTVAALARQHQVSLVFCGHVHESPGIFQWETRTVINPGPFCNGRYAVIDIPGVGSAFDMSLERL